MRLDVRRINDPRYVNVCIEADQLHATSRDWLVAKTRRRWRKIHYVSDIHVEFGALDKPLPEGDVLLLAGDTTVIACLAKHRSDAAARSVQKAPSDSMTRSPASFSAPTR